MSYQDPRTVAYRTRGDDWTLTGELQEDGQPVDLTGATIEAQIRTGEGEPVADFVASADLTPGTVVLSLARAVTEAIEPGVYVYDIQITSAGGARRTYGVDSRLVVRKDATYV